VVHFPEGVRYVCVLQNVQAVCWVDPVSYSTALIGGAEADHLPPFNAEVRNEWSCTCTPPPSICLRAVHADNCTFTVLLRVSELNVLPFPLLLFGAVAAQYILGIIFKYLPALLSSILCL
jgi:hypothetical protein